VRIRGSLPLSPQIALGEYSLEDFLSWALDMLAEMGASFRAVRDEP
jgi:hypothetical protein